MPTKESAFMVVLIASGYEWTCPKCAKLNHEIEAAYAVQCKKCGTIFVVEIVLHAGQHDNF